MDDVVLQVSDFVALVNQTLEFAYPSVVIEGEVSGFSISKNKWVFFDLKDAESTIGCFMTVYGLKHPVEDGMKLQVRAQPRLTKWGKFSVTVLSLRPIGEGSINRSLQLLKAQLEKEGLFASERKRSLPRFPARIGVVSSAQAAGYADFVKIVGERWGNVEIELANVAVQGEQAVTEITAGIRYFQQQTQPVDVLVIIRGGGSIDDLAAFSAEPVVRAVAASRIPTVVGVGHETDVSLADLAADVRAATPSNAAELVVPDRREVLDALSYLEQRMPQALLAQVERYQQRIHQWSQFLAAQLLAPKARLDLLEQKLISYNPANVLARGYSLVRTENGEVLRQAKQAKIGQKLMIELEAGRLGVTVYDKQDK
jgi:exodeoxyribonuclease VII large subunit